MLEVRGARWAGLLLLVLGGLVGGNSVSAAEGDGSTRFLVTVEPHHHKEEVPDLRPDDIKIAVEKQPRALQDWAPANGPLQLFILLDDGAESELALQFRDIKEFINRQPATTEIAIGYMRNGTVLTTQGFTADHALVEKGLRLPLGMAGANGSPYFSLSELTKRWAPTPGVRHEVVMVTDGVERYAGRFDPENPYVTKAIDDAQRAGVVVYAIYYAGGGHAGHSFYQVNWAQSYLSQVADDTGGEAYFQGTSSPSR